MHFRGLLVFFVCLMTVSAGFSQAVPTQTAVADAAIQPRGYVVGPGDEITGKVLGDPQYDFVATVDENGKLEIPFADNPLDAKCLTERDLKVEVTKLLKKYLRDPQLNIRVTDRKSRPPVSLTGEVRQQQQITLIRTAHLLELIAGAGGETERSGGVVQIYRPRPPMCSGDAAIAQWKAEADGALGVPSKTYSLNALRQGKGEANPEIFPGDVIVVLKAAPVYIVGEVVKPGEFGIPEEGLPLTQALAFASGITRNAKTKAIKIYRRKEGAGQPDVLTVDYNAIRKGELADPLLTPFDIVEVGKAPKKFTDYLIEFATGIPNRIPITY